MTRRPIGLLKILGILFKLLSGLSLLAMAAALVQVAMVGNPEQLPVTQYLLFITLNVAGPWFLIASLLYALGGIIKLLLILDERTQPTS
jgi:uncharacterized membrane protein